MAFAAIPAACGELGSRHKPMRFMRIFSLSPFAELHG